MLFIQHTDSNLVRENTGNGNINLSIDTVPDNVLVPLPVSDDSHYLTALRYIETNPLRPGLLKDTAERLKLILNNEAKRKK